MPSSILSHQAPALLINSKYPKKIDGIAICLGTIVPDICLFFDLFTDGFFRNISHSFLGLIIWTLPFTLVGTILFSKYIGPFLAQIANLDSFLSRGLRYFGVDLWNKWRFREFNKRFFIIASYSALIGGLTHLLLDFPAHENIELFFPFVLLKSPDFLLVVLFDYGTIQIGSRTIELALTVYNLIWFTESFFLIFPTLYFLRKIKVERMNKENNIEK